LSVKDASGRGEETRLDGDLAQRELDPAAVGLHDGQQIGQGRRWRSGKPQTGAPGEGGNGDPNRIPADDPAPGAS
jgi:hypothetical protein